MQRSSSKPIWLINLRRLIPGALFIIVYAFAAFGAAGAGHGTFILFAPLMPYGLGLVFYLAAFALASAFENRFLRNLCAVVLIVHYVVTALFVWKWWPHDSEYFFKTWDVAPVNILVPITLLVASNAYLWIRLVVTALSTDRDQGQTVPTI